MRKRKWRFSSEFALVINIDKIIDERAIWCSRRVPHLIHTKWNHKSLEAIKFVFYKCFVVEMPFCVSHSFGSIDGIRLVYIYIYLCVLLILYLLSCQATRILWRTTAFAHRAHIFFILCHTHLNAFCKSKESAAKKTNANLPALG